MTGNQLKNILDGVNVSLLHLNDRIDKLEAARRHDESKNEDLEDADYTLNDEAGWFDVGPFTVRLFLKHGDLQLQVYDQKVALRDLDKSLLYSFEVLERDLES